MGSVTEWIKREYGVRAESRERAVVLNAAAPVQVVQNDPNRFGLTVFNLGAAIAYLGFTSAVTAANGIQIAANGGFISLTARDDMELPGHQLYGIGAGATTLYVMETAGIQ